MKVILRINLFSKENPNGILYEKAYISEVVPRIGEKIKDSFFAEYKTIIDVISDLQNEECYVILESKELPHERFGGHIQEVAEMHQWIQASQTQD